MKKSGFAITKRAGFHMRFDNGINVSVQFGFGHYCENRNRENQKVMGDISSSTAEITAWDKTGKWITSAIAKKARLDDTGDGSVIGWQSPHSVARFLAVAETWLCATSGTSVE